MMLTQDTIDKLKEKLASAENPERAKPLTKMGVMRALYEEIENKSKNGWRHEDIVIWLKNQGIELSLNQFNRYLSDIRREKRLSGNTPTIEEKQQSLNLEKKVAVQARKIDKREEITSPKNTTKEHKVSAPVMSSNAKPQSEMPEDSDGAENVWNVKKPEVDEKGFVKQPHEK